MVNPVVNYLTMTNKGYYILMADQQPLRTTGSTGKLIQVMIFPGLYPPTPPCHNLYNYTDTFKGKVTLIRSQLIHMPLIYAELKSPKSEHILVKKEYLVIIFWGIFSYFFIKTCLLSSAAIWLSAVRVTRICQMAMSQLVRC